MSHACAGLVFAILLCGCMNGRPDVPLAMPAPAVASAYRVQVGDVLSVRLYMNPDLDEDVTVRPDGKISTTLAQSVAAAGRPPEAIAGELHDLYARELKNPDLTVEVKTPAPQRVFVAGEVVLPGEYDSAGPPLTLVQAMARAGGLRPTGDPEHVFIVRRLKGDTPQILAADYRAVAAARDGAADITLAPFDIVFVPKNRISQIYLWFNQHFQQFVPVSWGFSYNVNPYVNTSKP